MKDKQNTNNHETESKPTVDARSISNPAKKKAQPIGRVRERDVHINLEYEALVPRPSKEEVRALKLSIKSERQRDPIVVNPKGEVLDGHTRFKVLKELGRKVKFEVSYFPNKESERNFVLEAADLRRNLSAFQKIRMAQPLLEAERIKALDRKKQGKRQTSSPEDGQVAGEAIGIVAKRMGVKKRTFERGQFVLEHASPNQIDKLDRGEITISKLSNELRPVKMEKESDSRVMGKEVETTNSTTDESMEEKGDAINKLKKCQGKCNEQHPRGDMKLVLLCKKDRESAGVRF